MTANPNEPGTDRADQEKTSPADPHPHQPGSEEADRDKETTPAGVARDLEDKAEDIGASTDPDDNEQPRL
jgi:hypothetical protein